MGKGPNLSPPNKHMPKKNPYNSPYVRQFNASLMGSQQVSKAATINMGSQQVSLNMGSQQVSLNFNAVGSQQSLHGQSIRWSTATSTLAQSDLTQVSKEYLTLAIKGATWAATTANTQQANCCSNSSYVDITAVATWACTANTVNVDFNSI